jgi:hypothetical protein
MKRFQFLPHAHLHPCQQVRPQPYPQHKEKGWNEKDALKKA